MVAIEGLQHRKREFIIVKHGQDFYYARADRKDPDTYKIMVKVGEGEGREIVKKANASSDFNKEVDKFYEPK